jgi:hypothetical protein
MRLFHAAIHRLNGPLLRLTPIGVVLSGCLGATLSAAPALSAASPDVHTALSNVQMAAVGETSAVVSGNGVELLLPTGFSGGDPSQQQTQVILQETAKLFPKQADILKTFETNPAILRLLAVNFGTAAQPAPPQVVIVAKLPVPPGVSVADIHSQMAQAFGQILPSSFKLSDHRVATVGGREIAQFTVNANLKGVQLQEMIGIFKQGEDVFQVVYVMSKDATKGTTPAMMGNFEQMIRTFKVTGSGISGQST